MGAIFKEKCRSGALLELVGLKKGGIGSSQRPSLALFPTEREASSGAEELSFLTSIPVTYLPGWEVLPYERLSPAREIVARRITALSLLSKPGPGIVTVGPEGLLQRTISPGILADFTIDVRIGSNISRDELITSLLYAGYERQVVVEELGQFAVRGGVVDLFGPQLVSRLGGREESLAFDAPAIRIEFRLDSVSSIRRFSPTTQRSLANVAQATILPVTELLLKEDRSEFVGLIRKRATELELAPSYIRSLCELVEAGGSFPGIEQLLPLAAKELVPLWKFAPCDIAVWDLSRVLEAAGDSMRILKERYEVTTHSEGIYLPPESMFVSQEELDSELCNGLSLRFETLPSGDYSEVTAAEPAGDLEFELKLARYSKEPLRPLKIFLKEQLALGVRVLIVVSQLTRARRIEQLLSDYGISSQIVENEQSGFLEYWLSGGTGDKVEIVEGTLSGSLVFAKQNAVALAETSIFPDLTVRRRSTGAVSARRALTLLGQFQENDFIVHSDHGVGIYRGLKQIAVEGKIGDFLQLEYAEGAKLFLPVENIGKIQKYVAAEGRAPALSKLGGNTWQKTKAKVQGSVAELAGKLLNLYAEREVVQGYGFPELDSDDRAFAAEFAYTETPDQERAISDVLTDMTRSRPMDRLVCGDVGFGKTEVAMRAAFKAVNSGKQVCVLVPTTILADQHYATFKERLSGSPAVVRCLSRFVPPEERKETLQLLEQGRVDIVIGTHRLFSRDVVFRDLGLLIIDEEHRFGVAHKERLKKLKREVDVLTLTATPIPRTLHMSLAGIRDMSVIETAPVNREAIRTHLGAYDTELVREAILRELKRGGQIFYIYNRVETIASVTAELQALVPEARCQFAHGQLKETELEKIMHRFISKEFDLLVSTTIVESGLDIPNANTIIIRHADKFGLAELYQLRGRVGRSERRAYCYFLVESLDGLGVEARKRLEALQSLGDLGVGFRLAVQDMEIRGAGNLLGKDQSGTIGLVGYELYSRILREAVSELRARRRGEEIRKSPDTDPEIQIGFPAHIPISYLPDVAERLLIYQRLVELRSSTEVREMAEELTDRFGPPPREVELLLELMEFRAMLRRIGAVSARFSQDRLYIAMHRDAVLDPALVVRAIARYDGGLRVSPDSILRISVPAQEFASPVVLTRIVVSLAKELGLLEQTENV